MRAKTAHLPEQSSFLPAEKVATVNSKNGTLGLTFRDSKKLPVHGWFPYVEGFSAKYISELIREHGKDGIVYDPFGGSGTVNLLASLNGIPSAFSEANPFMRFVAETKINARLIAHKEFPEFQKSLSRLRSWIRDGSLQQSAKMQDLGTYHSAFAGRDFFEEKDIRDLQALKNFLPEVGARNPAFQQIFLLAIASVTVSCSNMTRRADLRRRRPDEYIGRTVNVGSSVLEKLAQMEQDIYLAPVRYAPAVFATADSRHRKSNMEKKVSLVLTSPPYLNGTNYIRNTKLELWLTGLIDSEDDLPLLNKICMVCGINNVVKGRPVSHRFDEVESVASQLEQVSPDLRIPAMVRGYFSDMYDVLSNCSSYLTDRGRIILDIGDSKFYGVHVPTDKILVRVANAAGLKLQSEKLLARRHSRDKTPLIQSELTFTHAA
ncbi:restriction endonuclease [Methylobacterium sp. WL12]|nr:restriction endonuclease [Methylobacterium sp. WL12]